MAGIDEKYLDPACLQDLVEGDPTDSGRFHRDGVDVTGFEPVGEGLEIARKTLELPDRLPVSIFRDGYPVALAADIDPGSVEVDLLKDSVASSALCSSLSLAVHGRLPHSQMVEIRGQGCVERAFS
jgi:hypothetical protein